MHKMQNNCSNAKFTLPSSLILPTEPNKMKFPLCIPSFNNLLYLPRDQMGALRNVFPRKHTEFPRKPRKRYIE